MEGSIRDLDVDHYTAFTSALTNLLSSQNAVTTYAEIIDGLPTTETWLASSHRRHDPILQHVELCPGSIETAERFRANLRPADLRFNPAARVPTIAT